MSPQTASLACLLLPLRHFLLLILLFLFLLLLPHFNVRHCMYLGKKYSIRLVVAWAPG